MKSENTNEVGRLVRQHRLLKGSMRYGDDEQEIVIRNLSMRGIGAATNGGVPPVGSDVTVRLPDGHIVDGQVRWSAGRNFGIAVSSDVPVEAQKAEPAPLQPDSNWLVVSRQQIPMPPTNESKLRRL